ncbi:MAG: hypothetical protein JOZ16_01405 [Methylobacteriaceae bacterium]|nr:hypothetical protein [Methylobacteriaceae bacterium]
MINPDNDRSSDAIVIGERAKDADETRWGMLLVLFMRIVAVLWVYQGLVQWHVILAAEQSIFDVLPVQTTLAVVFFAVLDLLAAVGMWLAAPWGGVLWLLTAIAQALVAVLLPDFFAGGHIVIGLNCILLVLYFLLTFKASQRPDYQRERVSASRITSIKLPPINIFGFRIFK